jgi:hypothetical protein
MKCLIELHPSAKEELKKAFQWYGKRSPGLGERFIKVPLLTEDEINCMKGLPEI